MSIDSRRGESFRRFATAPILPGELGMRLRHDLTPLNKFGKRLGTSREVQAPIYVCVVSCPDDGGAVGRRRGAAGGAVRRGGAVAAGPMRAARARHDELAV